MTEEVEIQEDELTALKERANIMGIKFHPNIGIDALRERLEPLLSNPEQNIVEESNDVSGDETAKQQLARLTAECNRLVRCRITSMNPMKKSYTGEIFTAGNRAIGTIKKFVHYDVPWHIPQMILTQIENAEYQTFMDIKDGKGNKIRRGKLVKAFSVEILPDLTKDELHALAQRQAMANGTSESL